MYLTLCKQQNWYPISEIREEEDFVRARVRGTTPMLLLIAEFYYIIDLG